MNQPNASKKRKWAKALCDSLKDNGIRASFKIDDGVVVVTYRIADRTWNYWKHSPGALGGKTKKKIQRIYIVQSTKGAPNYLGEMCPQQRWRCEETDQIIQGCPLEYTTKRAKRLR